MGLKCSHFSDNHLVAMVLGVKFIVSAHNLDHYYSNNCKVVIDSIKLGNTWIPFETFISNVANITGYTVEETREVYKTVLTRINALFRGSSVGNAWLSGQWYTFPADDDFHISLCNYLDQTYGEWLDTTNIDNMVVTIEPQRVKYPKSSDEIYELSSNVNYYYDDNFTGVVTDFSNITSLGLLDLGESTHIANFNQVHSARYYNRMFGESLPAVFTFWKNCYSYASKVAMLYNVTVSNHPLYGTKTLQFYGGYMPSSIATSWMGAFYMADTWSADIGFVYDSHYRLDMDYLTLITDNQFYKNISTVPANKTIRYFYSDSSDWRAYTSNEAYYIKTYGTPPEISNFNVTSVETLMNHNYKISGTFNIDIDEDYSSLASVHIDVEGYKFIVPLKSGTYSAYTIIESTEDIAVIRPSYYVKALANTPEHTYASGESNIRYFTNYNRILLPKENNDSFGLKFDNTNNAVYLANVDYTFANSIVCDALGINSIVNSPCILHLASENNVYIDVVINNDDAAQDNYYAYFSRTINSDTHYNTSDDALQEHDTYYYQKTITLFNRTFEVLTNVLVHYVQSSNNYYYNSVGYSFSGHFTKQELNYLYSNLKYSTTYGLYI